MDASHTDARDIAAQGKDVCPGRRAITAAVVAEADRLLALGFTPAAIATRLRITEYVVRVMAEDQDRAGRKPPADMSGCRFPARQNCVDVATVRMIRRMLEVGWLNHRGIAREAGVSPNFVAAVAQGRRLPISTERPPLAQGERFLPVPIRCSGCHGLIAIVPCRACKARASSQLPRCTASTGSGRSR